MTEEELRVKITIATAKATLYIRDKAPKDTGNLAYVAVRYERTGIDTWKIFISLEYAPYAPYVNEKWVSPRWHGKKNPNEGWWNRTIDEVVRIISAEIGGEIKR